MVRNRSIILRDPFLLLQKMPKAKEVQYLFDNIDDVSTDEIMASKIDASTKNLLLQYKQRVSVDDILNATAEKEYYTKNTIGEVYIVKTNFTIPARLSMEVECTEPILLINDEIMVNSTRLKISSVKDIKKYIEYHSITDILTYRDIYNEYLKTKYPTVDEIITTNAVTKSGFAFKKE